MRQIGKYSTVQLKHYFTRKIMQYGICKLRRYETSLLRRLQMQTLPDEAPPIGKIHRFSKMAVTERILMPFGI